MADNQTLPPQGDGNYTAGQNVPNLNDILRQGPNADFLFGSESLPEKDGVPAPDDSEGSDDVPQSTDGDGNASDKDNGVPAVGDETGEDSTDTQDTAGLNAEDDIDWEYKVPVKIDGEEKYFTLEELRKGYATSQHLSAEGRKLGEARKALEAERNEKLNELVQLGTSLHSQLEADESALSTRYHSIKEQMEKAIEEGDGYEAKQLKEQLTEVQKQYWDKRNQKTSLTDQVGKQVAEAQARQQQAQLEYFQENIGKVLPNFTTELAGQIREFALNEGLPEELLAGVYEPKIVKVLHDYMTLKNKASAGAQKRETTTKTVPTKKSTPQKTRNEQQYAQTKAKVFSGEGSKEDQLAVLKGLSSFNRRFG